MLILGFRFPLFPQDLHPDVPPYFPLKQLEVSQFKARAQQYRAFVLFWAYTAQRSVSTIARLNVEQCRDAIETDPPCLLVKASQDKMHMEHYVPVHAAVISSLRPLFNGKKDGESLFRYNSFQILGETCQDTPFASEFAFCAW